LHYKAKPQRLTKRETEILQAVVEYKDFSEKFLSSHFGIATDTVAVHKNHIFKKLGAQSGVEAVLKWLEVRI
jgi:DNA-binding NarL/FixJ family response regulator